MINGAITRKLNLLDENIRKLESLGKVTTAQLNENWQMKFAIERNLQITIEIVIDICQRIISLEGDAPVAKSTESIERCVEIGALSKNEAYKKMVQFRNFIVHRYEQIDTEILVAMVNNRLDDFKEIKKDILNYAKAKN